MNLEFLPYVIPAIVLVGWAIGLVKGNEAQISKDNLFKVVIGLMFIAILIDLYCIAIIGTLEAKIFSKTLMTMFSISNAAYKRPYSKGSSNFWIFCAVLNLFSLIINIVLL